MVTNLNFDPTKTHVSKVTGDGSKFIKPPGLSKEQEDAYDPTKMIDMIEKVKKDRENALETKIADRQITVINYIKSGDNMK